MNYGAILTCDIANGPGMRVSLFVSGCTHHCEGCFNGKTWSFSYGEPYTDTVKQNILDELKHPWYRGITFLGGEPMEPENQIEVLSTIKAIRERFGNSRDIWLYSGYTWEELNNPANQRCHSEDTEAILSMIDVLVDGEFVLEKKDISLTFRGSSNQRIIDVPATLKNGYVVLSKYHTQ